MSFATCVVRHFPCTPIDGLVGAPSFACHGLVLHPWCRPPRVDAVRLTYPPSYFRHRSDVDPRASVPPFGFPYCPGRTFPFEPRSHPLSNPRQDGVRSSRHHSSCGAAAPSAALVAPRPRLRGSHVKPKSGRKAWNRSRREGKRREDVRGRCRWKDFEPIPNQQKKCLSHWRSSFSSHFDCCSRHDDVHPSWHEPLLRLGIAEGSKE